MPLLASGFFGPVSLTTAYFISVKNRSASRSFPASISPKHSRSHQITYAHKWTVMALPYFIQTWQPPGAGCHVTGDIRPRANRNPKLVREQNWRIKLDIQPDLKLNYIRRKDVSGFFRKSSALIRPILMLHLAPPVTVIGLLLLLFIKYTGLTIVQPVAS